MLKGAYLFVYPESNPQKHRAVIETPKLHMTIVGNKDFDEAVNTAKSLVEEGVKLFDLCGGFGPVGAAKIIEAVGDKAAVGGVNYGLESAEKVFALLKE